MTKGFDLWRAIDAEGGASPGEYWLGHSDGLKDALFHVERLGYVEGTIVPPYEPERGHVSRDWLARKVAEAHLWPDAWDKMGDAERDYARVIVDAILPWLAPSS